MRRRRGRGSMDVVMNFLPPASAQYRPRYPVESVIIRGCMGASLVHGESSAYDGAPCAGRGGAVVVGCDRASNADGPSVPNESQSADPERALFPGGQPL